ncbi:MAG TPA: methyl-accepting chemotaxis protein, partial [Spirochaetia bacterium]|nr:methyl-accepting chemotaxis protein [Spirochaetia bacterium]
ATDQQLEARAGNIARTIDGVFQEKLKLARLIANQPSIVGAVADVAEKGSAAPRVAAATDFVTGLKQAKGVGEDYASVMVMDRNGTAIATSDARYLGVSFADRDYFKAAMAGTATAGNAVLDKVTNKPVVPVVAPIRDPRTGATIGALVMGVDFTFVPNLIANEKIGKGGYAMVLDSTGIYIAHPDATRIFKENFAKMSGSEELGQTVLANDAGEGDYVRDGVAKTAGYAAVPTTGWHVLFTYPRSEFMAPTDQVRNFIYVMNGAAIVVAFLVYFFFSRTITRPIVRSVAFAQLVASGDFTQTMEVRRRDEVGTLVVALNGMSAKLKDMVANVQQSAQQVAAASEELSASAQSLAEGSQTQASTLEETSASVEELTASVDQVAESAQTQAAAVEEGTGSMAQVQQSIDEVSSSLEEIADLAARSVENSMQGADSVGQVMEGIRRIAQSSEKIGGIVAVIADIADQTNLLALNASIEAARAGEHGRGFAVVADEVSKLADRSARSAKEIEALIKEGARNVTAGVETARGSQGTMELIRAASQRVKDMIGSLTQSMQQQVAAVEEFTKALESVSEMSQSISAATEEQTTNAKQVSKAVENVNEITQSAASAAEQMSSSTEQLAGMAQELQRMMSQFRITEGGETAAEMQAAQVAAPQVVTQQTQTGPGATAASPAANGRPHLALVRQESSQAKA